MNILRQSSVDDRDQRIFLPTTTSKFMHLLQSKFSQFMDSPRRQEDTYLRRLELTNIIKIYFEFTYHLGASSFHFAKDVGSGYYYVKVWKPQQVICILLDILCILVLIAEIRESIPKDISVLKSAAAPYFVIVLSCCGLAYKSITKKRFWFNREMYLKILNFALKEKYLPVNNKQVTKQLFIYMLFGFNTFKILACFISGYRFVIPVGRWSPSWWLRRLVAHAHFVLCFGEKLASDKAPELADISVWDGILAVLVALGQINRWIMGEFCDLCILSVALTLWTTASSFDSDITNMLRIDEEWDEQTENGELPKIITVRGSADSHHHHHSQPWSLIYRNFQAIQKFSEIVNKALGTQVTWYMAEGMMYYSINLNTVLLTRDEFSRFHKVVFYWLTFGILYISASICSKMESAKEWLVTNNNIKTVPRDEANLVLHENLTKDIGIRGSNMFTLTFPMVAGFLSLIVTFFVICVQVQLGDGSVL